MRRYHVHHASYLHKMPDNLTYADGALLEPLSVALRGFERGPLKLGEAGVVFGAGPIGLITLAVAKAAGAWALAPRFDPLGKRRRPASFQAKIVAGYEAPGRPVRRSGWRAGR